MRRAQSLVQLPQPALAGVALPPMASLQATGRPLNVGEVPLELLVGGLEIKLIGQVVMTIGAKLGD